VSRISSGDLKVVFLYKVLSSIGVLETQIGAAVSDAEAQLCQLTTLKETNRDTAAQQADLHKDNVRLRKEVETLAASIEQHVKVVHEDYITISRTKLMVGQEMASSYALYQASVAD
jgi:predicted  nucleic acid-binding Zn-ribbon protein